LMVSGLMVLLLTLLALVPSQWSAVADPRAAGVKGAAALGRLESLPVQAQSVISGALGAGAAAFAAERRAGGYGLAGGGVAADLNGREVAVRVSGGTLSLALSAVGRGVRLAAVGRASLAADANRVTYRRAGVREWYAAGPLGIEQGFTLTRRPAGAAGPVTLAVRLGGSLRAQLAGAQVRFLASSGWVGRATEGSPRWTRAGGGCPRRSRCGATGCCCLSMIVAPITRCGSTRLSSTDPNSPPPTEPATANLAMAWRYQPVATPR
jgi:hypothetical protein